ncbi:MAG: Smr/MutS family protein [Gemmatimonadaceae bacterium]|nr:Smr/MutS family protein [Gemmatimonadaceae bacterium]
MVKTPRARTLHQAFDEMRFGADRTLNLRTHHPSREQALRRAENWLRERQMSRAAEALVITGRGNNSPDGVSVVREAIVQLFASLRRRGVLAEVIEHTPGSFVVTFAKLSAVRDAPQRSRNPHEPPPSDPASLAALEPETRALLRRLAQRAIEELGVAPTPGFVEQEMLAQFAAAASGVPEGARREERLRDALRAALLEYDDR